MGVTGVEESHLHRTPPTTARATGLQPALPRSEPEAMLHRNHAVHLSVNDPDTSMMNNDGAQSCASRAARQKAREIWPKVQGRRPHCGNLLAGLLVAVGPLS